MSTLEVRIAEVLAPLLYGEGRLQWERKWAEASPIVKSAWNVLAKEYAAALAPVIREREIDVWDECDNAWTAAHKMSNYDPWEFLPDGNPYRADNLEAS